MIVSPTLEGPHRLRFLSVRGSVSFGRTPGVRGRGTHTSRPGVTTFVVGRGPKDEMGDRVKKDLPTNYETMNTGTSTSVTLCTLRNFGTSSLKFSVHPFVPLGFITRVS